MAYTVVFEGKIQDFEGNPLKAQTVYGKPLACGVGDAFKASDDVSDVIQEMIESLEHALVYVARYENDNMSNAALGVLERARASIRRAKEVVAP